MYTRSGGGSATLTQSQVSGLCHQAGIAGPVVAKVLEVGAFDPAAIDMHKFVFLMLAMSCEDFNRWGAGVGWGERGGGGAGRWDGLPSGPERMNW